MGQDNPGKRTNAKMLHPLRCPPLSYPPRRETPRDVAPPWGHRLVGAARDDAPLDPLARPPKVALLEAALMTAEEPLSARRLSVVIGLDGTGETRKLILQLRELLAKEDSAFTVEELAGGWQLLTRPEFQPWLARQRRPGSDFKLTSASRETLAIVAYRQPIMRAELEAIRGVQSGEILRLLMEKGLVRIAGRDESLGRPVLYGTTKKFLQMMGLRNLSDLPRASDLRRPAHPTKPEDDG